MNANFAAINMDENPILILKRPDGTPIGVLGGATDVVFEPNYNELSQLSFKLPAKIDGMDTPFYDDAVGLMIVELKDIGQFVIMSPEENGDKILLSKEITADSLECEFGRKKITLPESTYKFYDSTSPSGTVLGMIMEQMPTWHIGNISQSIADKYRTFDVSNDNLYNFIKGTAQQAYNCIFEFNTLTRTVSVRDADDTPSQKQVFISRENLAKDIKVTEETGDIVTRLDVSGADGVDIREVNPTGTNQIINLDYFMEHGFFSAALVSKYNAWKTLINNNKPVYYNYAVQYSLSVSEETAENAKLEDLRGEYTSLENIQAVIIQGIASGLRTQADLDVANQNLRNKQAEINAKTSEIASITNEKATLLNNMTTIVNQCAFDRYFTQAERRTMSPYIIDNEVSETSFVANEVASYSDGDGNKISGKQISFTGAEVVRTVTSTATLYNVSGGNISVPGILSGRNVSAIVEVRNNGKVVISVYAGNGTYNSASYPSACVSASGTGSASWSSSSVTCTVTGTLYFSLNANDYEKKSVAWDLYEYGESLLAKMAQPSYSFSVDSANFIALEDFILFKNELELGQRIYIEVAEGKILKPICTGAKIYFDDRPKLELLFTDTYTATDSQSKLVDLLENSVSMGKTLSSGKFTYEAWTGSGANTDLKEFITSALDTSKNAIMSSTEQAVSWDGAGLRLRRYKDGSGHSAYDGEQIWMSNNSIMMTDDGWATAKMAIGKFKDANAGDQWGVIAPMLVGTILAGESLIIESSTKYGTTAQFRVDGDGTRLYNANFEIQKTTGSTTSQIMMDPSVGVAMGTYPVVNSDGTINETNAKFWVDASGTMHLKGSIITGDGSIAGWTIGPNKISSGAGGNHVAISSDSDSDYRIWAGNETASSAPFSVQANGKVYAADGEFAGTMYIRGGEMTAGTIKGDTSMTGGTAGGWHISSEHIGNNAAKSDSTIAIASGTGSAVVIWAGGTPTEVEGKTLAPFRVQADGKVYATDGEFSGTMYIRGGEMTGGTIEGSTAMTGGTAGGWCISASHIGNAASKDDSSVGLASSTSGTDIVIWAGNKTQANAPFKVQANGKIIATDGEFTGTMHITGGDMTGGTISGDTAMTGGTAGGWYIGSDYIGNASTKDGSSVGLSSGTGTSIVMWAGSTTQESAAFRVQADGHVYASNLDITGGSIVIKDGSTEKFKVTSTGAVTAADLTITGGSITIGSNFSVDSNGNVTIGAGSITIGSNFSVDSKGNVTIGAGSISIGGKFSVDSNGNVTINGGNISMTSGSIALGDDFAVATDGTLTAKAGTVGGWYISDNHIGNKALRDCTQNPDGSYKDDGSTIGMSTGTGNDVVFWAGGTRGEIPGKTRAPFRVEADGDLYASTGTFGGTVYATQVSTALGALVSDQIGESEIKTININASAITEQKLDSGAVSGGKIKDNAVSYAKAASGVQKSLDNGDTAIAKFDSLVGGSMTADYIKAKTVHATSLYVGGGSGSLKNAIWHSGVTVVTAVDFENKSVSTDSVGQYLGT